MTKGEIFPTYLAVERDRDVTIARFTVPRLTEEENIEQLGHELALLTEKSDHRKVALDLSGVELLTSSALGKIITLHRKLHRSDGRLVLCNLSPQVREVMRVSRLIDYFKTAEDVPAAVAALQVKSAPVV